MRQLSLVWQFREHSNETDSSSPGASSEVIERVVLQPEEEKMVRDMSLVHSALISLVCQYRLRGRSVTSRHVTCGVWCVVCGVVMQYRSELPLYTLLLN